MLMFRKVDPVASVLWGIVILVALFACSVCGSYVVVVWANNGETNDTLYALGRTLWGMYSCYGTLCLGALLAPASPRIVAIIFNQQ